jgi:hypothetical protein
MIRRRATPSNDAGVEAEAAARRAGEGVPAMLAGRDDRLNPSTIRSMDVRSSAASFVSISANARSWAFRSSFRSGFISALWRGNDRWSYSTRDQQTQLNRKGATYNPTVGAFQLARALPLTHPPRPPRMWYSVVVYKWRLRSDGEKEGHRNSPNRGRGHWRG